MIPIFPQTTERRRHQTDPSVGNQYVDDEVESKLSKKKKSTKNKKGKGEDKLFYKETLIV